MAGLAEMRSKCKKGVSGFLSFRCAETFLRLRSALATNRCRGWKVGLPLRRKAFIQVIFALHYAHDYCAAACDGHPAGLQFPGHGQPDYDDFFYFASVIGTSELTADVSFLSEPIRHVGPLHCILAYRFDTTVLAQLIDIGASMF